jgi:hypothetical protein
LKLPRVHEKQSASRREEALMRPVLVSKLKLVQNSIHILHPDVYRLLQCACLLLVSAICC